MFVKTMGDKEDKRLPRMTIGLGVVVGKEARFYKKTPTVVGLVD